MSPGYCPWVVTFEFWSHVRRQLHWDLYFCHNSSARMILTDCTFPLTRFTLTKQNSYGAMPYQLHSREAVACDIRWATDMTIAEHDSREFPIIGVPAGSTVNLLTVDIDVIGLNPARISLFLLAMEKVRESEFTTFNAHRRA